MIPRSSLWCRVGRRRVPHHFSGTSSLCNPKVCTASKQRRTQSGQREFPEGTVACSPKPAKGFAVGCRQPICPLQPRVWAAGLPRIVPMTRRLTCCYRLLENNLFGAGTGLTPVWQAFFWCFFLSATDARTSSRGRLRAVPSQMVAKLTDAKLIAIEMFALPKSEGGKRWERS